MCMLTPNSNKRNLVEQMYEGKVEIFLEKLTTREGSWQKRVQAEVTKRLKFARTKGKEEAVGSRNEVMKVRQIRTLHKVY